MAIEGLNNMFRVPSIKKERMPEDEKKNKKKKKSGDEKKEHPDSGNKREGRIDIRI